MSAILSVSVPPSLRDELDAEAGRQRRSRSFVVVEAVRAYLAARQREAFDEGTLRTLTSGLARTPAERVALSESLWRELARQRHPPGQPWVKSFNTHEEHQRWCREGDRSG